MRTATESKLEIQSKMARFQCWRSLRRWKAHAKMIKQQSLLRQRAYFFLYYQLMKKSILRLRKYASLKQNDCKNMNVIDSARRNALLRFALTLWSQKRSKRWVLREWRTESLRKQSGSTKYNKTIERISSKYRSNLLYKLFQLWRRHFLGRKIHRAILNVLDKYQLNLVQLAWKQWKDQMARMVDIEQVMQNRRMRLLQQSWKGWKIQTASKQKRENDRRRAVRFYYLSLLKNGFNAFQKTIERRSRLLDLASKKRYEREKRSLTQSFRSWKSFTNAQKDTARKKWIAVDHYELQLVNKVWSRGFCRALEQTRAIACKLDKMRVLSQNRLQAEMFAHWKEIYIFERNRIQLLEVKLVKHLQQKQLASKQQIFVAWAEYRHERFAKRVITAQIYGQWQLKLLQNVFTKWQTGIAAAKWQQILNERANRHYAKNLTKKAFARWIVKNAQMQDYWEQTKSALIHWKLTLERKMFVRLKLYATSKNRQRKRMHGAFEFRQDFFLREGLRHWITAATHLHQQRETRLGNAQAVKTSRIWCKVAAIARHWYHLTLKRKLQTPQTPAVQRKGSTTLLPESLHDHEGWLVQRRAQLHSPAIFGHENVKNVRVKHSNLSEFVMLPRTRPQPRRPVDLLFAGAECLTVQNIENDSSTAMFDLRSKYGFQFEVGVPSAFPVSKDSLHKRNQFMVDQKETYVAAPPILPPSEPSMEGIDDLEQQLLRWKTWKTDWKMFQATIESARADLEEAMMNRYVFPLVSCFWLTLHRVCSLRNILQKCYQRNDLCDAR